MAESELRWSQGAIAAHHALKPLALLALFVYCVRVQLRSSSAMPAQSME